MKKLFSLLLAAVLALGLTTIAWAVTEEEPGGQAGQTYTDDDRIVIEKCYRLVNDGAVSPAETFHFTLTTLGVTDSTETLDTMPRFTDADGAPITGFDISFAEGEATAAGTVKSYTLMLPEYDTVGIYSYEIAEVVDDDARTAGVTYNGQKLLLKVTVIQTEDGRVRVAAVHLGNEDGDKVKQVVNTYAAGTLDVTKTVAGLMGEANRDFRFTVTLTRPAELVMASTIGLTVAGTAQSFTPVWDSNGRCTVTFDLRHGQTASLTNLPYGMSYTVAEDDYTAIGYTTEKTGDSGTISAAGVTAAFTNAKGGSVDTGVLLDSAPYAMLLVLALAGGAYTLAVDGGGAVTLRIPCEKAGKYRYTLCQEPGKLARGQYDHRTYYITVTVTEDGRVTAAVYGDAAQEGDKYDAIEFVNRYLYRPDPEDPVKPSPKTGDGGLGLLAALALSSGAGIAALGGTAAVAALLRRQEP